MQEITEDQWEYVRKHMSKLKSDASFNKAQGAVVSHTTPEKTHEVAMAAAEAAMRVPTHSPANIGLKFALAYLQAYEAVEGWTKPTTASSSKSYDPGNLICENSTEVKRVYFSIGNDVTLINKATGRGLEVKLKDDGSWEWKSFQPKDA